MNVPQTQNQNLPATNDPNYNPYTAANDFLGPNNTIVGHLLKFTKFGEFLAGQDGVKIEHGTKLIAHMPDLLLGWQRWEDNKPVEQVMGFLRDGFIPPKRPDLGNTDKAMWEVDDQGKERDPWQKTAMLIFKGFDDDELYTYSTSSTGGLGAINSLRKAYGNAMRMRPKQLPVVELGWGEYPHQNKSYGMIRYPTFEIVDWVHREVMDRALDAGAGDPPNDAQQELLPQQGTEMPPPNEARGRQASQQQAQTDYQRQQRQLTGQQTPQRAQAPQQQPSRQGTQTRGTRF